MQTRSELLAATTEIVSAFVSCNPTSAADLLSLIRQTLAALAATGPQPEAQVPNKPQKPAVPIKKSVAANHITCLEDGRQFKSLKRHLRADHGFEPSEYRAKWGLPKDYPMAAPNYTIARSRLAREAGLGRKQTEGVP